MIIDFKNIDLHERPTLILRNLDCAAYGTLGKAFNVKADLKLNELSVLTFDCPEFESGNKTLFYDQIRAMNIIELCGIGLFILKSAKASSDGIRSIKTCQAYSLEQELVYKQFFASKGTYNFWNPVSPENTILGMIADTIPYWNIGTVDSKLIGKYRTFECGNQNVYDFMKNTAQSAYGCLFTFDTYNRKINVTDVTSFIATKPIYLSHYNLLKNLEIAHDTENIFTCFEGYGADDLTIRSVNPTGTNKVYNLDYFMTETNLSREIIEKWSIWKKLFDDRQLPYYNLMIEESIQASRLLTEQAELTAKKGDLKKLETLQSSSVEYLGEHPHDATEQKNLEQINAKIVVQKGAIASQEALLLEVQSEIDAITAEKTAINKELAFDTTFTATEFASLSKYIKEETVQDSSFVVGKVKNYNTADESSKHENATFSITEGNVTRILGRNGKELYSITGGRLVCPCGEQTLSADVVRGSLERKTDGSFVFSAYLNTGKIGTEHFPSGNISVTGMAGPISTDVVPDEEVPDAYKTGTSVSYVAEAARVYFTQNATEYEARSVQFDLYDHVKLCLEKASQPAYSFTLDSANFLAVDDFVSFKNNFSLGERVYLNAGSFGILQPIVIGVSIEYEDLGSFTMEFSDKFSTKDSMFQIAEMLKESVSMGKKFSSDQYSVGEYSRTGAATTIDDYITNARDVAKQEILATVGQAISWDENGLRGRKWNADRSGYEPQQMWMNNNQLLFTSDNWDSVRTAFGRINVGGTSMYGLVGEVILGDIIAGKNLTIRSEVVSPP